MSTWKKAISLLAVAGIAASLFASPVLATKSATETGSDQTDYLNCSVAEVTSTCTQVAGFGSQVILAGDATGGSAQLFITISGAGTFAAAGGNFSWVSASEVASRNLTAYTYGAGDTITVRSTGTAGTATVTVYKVVGGASTKEGTMTVTFSASSGLTLDTASTVVATTGSNPMGDGHVDPATELVTSVPAGSSVQGTGDLVWVLLLNKNGDPYVLKTGDSVTLAISGPGFLGSAGVSSKTWTSGDAATATVCVGKDNATCTDFTGYGVELYRSGTAGVATISATLRNGTTTTALGTSKITFTGAVASFAVSGGASVAKNAAAADAIEIVAKDANGNEVPLNGAVTLSSSPSGIVTTGTATYDADDEVSYVTPTCAANAGTYVVTVKASVGGSTITGAGTASITCGAGAPAKITLVPASAVGAGGTTKVKVTVLDKDGLPVVEGTPVTRLVGAGAATEASNTSNGVSTFTWVAPNTTGPVTLWAFAGTAGAGSVTINVGGGTAASGITAKVGSGTAAAKTAVAKRGQTITWTGALGSSAASASVGVYVRFRAADGSWGAIRRWATRTADASGNVTFSYKYTSSKWIQIRFVGGSSSTSFLGGVWR